MIKCLEQKGPHGKHHKLHATSPECPTSQGAKGTVGTPVPSSERLHVALCLPPRYTILGQKSRLREALHWLDPAAPGPGGQPPAARPSPAFPVARGRSFWRRCARARHRAHPLPQHHHHLPQVPQDHPCHPGLQLPQDTEEVPVQRGAPELRFAGQKWSTCWRTDWSRLQGAGPLPQRVQVWFR